MGINCAYLSLYSYATEFIQKLIEGKTITEDTAFNLTYRYIDDVLPLNNPKFAYWNPLLYQKIT